MATLKFDASQVNHRRLNKQLLTLKNDFKKAIRAKIRTLTGKDHTFIDLSEDSITLEYVTSGATIELTRIYRDGGIVKANTTTGRMEDSHIDSLGIGQLSELLDKLHEQV